MTTPSPEPRIRGFTAKRITVPGNFAQGCEEFNSGKYYECHETFEEIWQEEQGEVRDLYKGLIQVAAAFVHISRGNYRGARRLLSTAIGYLEPYRAPGAMGFNVDEICERAERALERVEAQGPDGVENEPGMAPVYRCDQARIPEEARRWKAWGFDREGSALEMEILVPEEKA
jgi:uncharacterized protein